jgi:hypothetical protein
MKSELKKFLKEKGFRTSIKTVSPKHSNPGFLIVSLQEATEGKFRPVLESVCKDVERSSPGTYIIDPETINLSTCH